MKRITNKLTQYEHLKEIEIYPTSYKKIDVWFTDERVQLPDDSGIYKYEVRHDNGDPIELCEHVAVDFYGTILSLEPIALPKVALNFLNFDDIFIWSKDFYVKSYENPITVYDLIKKNKEKKWM